MNQAKSYSQNGAQFQILHPYYPLEMQQNTYNDKFVKDHVSFGGKQDGIEKIKMSIKKQGRFKKYVNVVYE